MSQPAEEEEAYDDSDNADAWDEALYGGEQDDDDLMCGGDESLKQQLKLMKLKRTVSIKFSPPGYQPGTLPQICGDLTEWIPFNMKPVVSGAENDFEFTS
jgi:hypothetical protein